MSVNDDKPSIDQLIETCSFPDCGKAVHAKGLCPGHCAQRLRGVKLRPLHRRRSESMPLDEFIASETAVDPSTGCHEWTRRKGPAGYGVLDIGGRPQGMHRIAWTLANGDIPDGMVIDHRCGNRACVNVGHLRVATQCENSQYHTKLNPRNVSGYRGVQRNGKRWRARVYVNGVTHHLGYFDTAEEADAVACQFRAERFRLHGEAENRPNH